MFTGNDHSQSLMGAKLNQDPSSDIFIKDLTRGRVRNLKFATYLKFATCGNTNKINEFR